MVLSRKKRKEALSYVLKEVLECENDEPLATSLKQNGIEDISFLICMSYHDINSMDYVSDKGICKDLDEERKTDLHTFQAFYHHKLLSDKLVGDNWFEVTPKEFDKYCINSGKSPIKRNKNKLAISLSPTSKTPITATSDLESISNATSQLPNEDLAASNNCNNNLHDKTQQDFVESNNHKQNPTSQSLYFMESNNHDNIQSCQTWP